MAMSKLKRKLIKTELAKIGFRDATFSEEKDAIVVDPNNEHMPTIGDNGGILCDREYRQLVIEHIQPIVSKVKEIVSAWERSSANPVESLENYRLLSEYNGVVLAARDDSKKAYEHGMEFATWEYSDDRSSFINGKYTTDYDKAKEDFAVRCGLVNRYKMLSETELKLIHQGLVHLGANYPHLTSEQMTNVGKLIEKVEMIVPEIQERSAYEAHELLPEDGLEI